MFVELSEITKVYPIGEESFKALNNLSLSIEKGDFVAIIGASGSGKSTLMNIIGCLDSPNSGSYLLEEEDITKQNSKRLARIRNEKIGFIFQGFNLLGRATAIENVLLPLCYANVPRFKRRGMANEMLSKVGLSTKINRLPTKLSGGEQQRVAIARALVNNPSIICADEPTGNLDTSTSYEIMKIFKELNEQGRTIILVTHETDIANYANRVITLRDGMIIRDDIKSNV
ncbi:MAG: ABC transporter ATP-binding protein [bacterium]